MKVVKLLNDATRFPFEIILTFSQEVNIENPSVPNQNKGTFEIRFTWPYEIADADAEEDEIEQKNNLDTQWGYDIAQFYENLPEGDTSQGIEITLTAIARQII